MQIKKLAFAIAILPFFTTGALAVSVGEMISKCGDDGEAYCEGVGYGDPMQDCLQANYSSLSGDCQSVMDRINGGERVTLF